jgi:hypothetical protein
MALVLIQVTKNKTYRKAGRSKPLLYSYSRECAWQRQRSHPFGRLPCDSGCNLNNAETSLPQITLATRRSWAQILLVCARNMALLTSFRTKLKQDATLAKDMARFILTCVASVGGSDSDRLRSAAWSTTASLFCSRVFGNGSL